MNRNLFIVVVFAAMILVVGCRKDRPVDAVSVKTEEAGSVTDKAAILNASVTFRSVEAADFVCGFLVGTSSNPGPGNAIWVEAGNPGGDGKFSARVSDLDFNTTYYFKAFVSADAESFYGSVKSFETSFNPVQSITVVPDAVTVNIAGDPVTLTARISPPNVSQNTVTWSSSDEKVVRVNEGKLRGVAPGTAVVTATATDGSGVKGVCSVTVVRIPTEAVDMGLSVYWAPCNRGTSKPEQAGSYFAWGETSSKESYTWATYELCKGTARTLQAYNVSSGYGVVDNATRLLPKDDAARAIMGGRWRIPTKEDWAELRKECTWVLGAMNKVQGYYVTSNKEGYTDKTIFIPFVGYKSGEEIKFDEAHGYYWMSDLFTSTPSEAYIEYIHTTSHYLNSHLRCDGLPIRPVSD